MRDCHLIVHDRLISALLLEHFGLKLHRLHVVCHVVEVDCGRLLLQKIDALDPNLRKLLAPLFKRRLNRRLFSVKPAPGGSLDAIFLLLCLLFRWRDDDLINAVRLVWLILLGRDDLVEVDEA